MYLIVIKIFKSPLLKLQKYLRIGNMEIIAFASGKPCGLIQDACRKAVHTLML